MKMSKTGIFAMATLLLVAFTLSYDGPDPAYFKAFGYGSIAASIGGRPSFDKYNPAQYDYQNGIFYISPTAERLDLRALLPEGQTYESMMKALFKNKASLLEGKKRKLFTGMPGVRMNMMEPGNIPNGKKDLHILITTIKLFGGNR